MCVACSCSAKQLLQNNAMYLKKKRTINHMRFLDLNEVKHGLKAKSEDF